jgi:molybdate transport system substrate-binding protein
MRISSAAAAAKIGCVLLLAQGVAAKAAEVTVLSAFPMRPVITEAGPEFERTTGHKLATKVDVVGVLKRQIEAGETFDVAILTSPIIDDLVKQGKIAAGTNAGIARVGTSVGVRAGAPKPDISSAEAFKRALLNAKSIAYTPEGVTGMHLVGVFERLGIAEQMKAKTKPQKGGDGIVQAIASGEAELGLAITNIFLSVPGVEHTGPFPEELQNYVVYTAGVGAGAKDAEAGKALIKFLTAPGAVPVIKAKGLEPVSK